MTFFSTYLIGLLWVAAMTSMLSGCASIPRTISDIRPGNIKDVEWFLSNNIGYMRHGPHGTVDKTKSADQIIADGFGNCEDYALVTKAIIDSWPGWYSQIIYKGEAHKVCLVVGPDGIVGYFDEGEWINNLVGLNK